MAFHIFDLGPVSARVQRFADVDGYVPEPQDHWQEFHWSQRELRWFTDKQDGESHWQEFVQDSFTATSEAFEVLENLHESRYGL